MLQHLLGYVQGQILRIHQPANKTEMIRQQVGAFVHDQHPVGIELQTLFILFAVVVVRGAAGTNIRAL